MAPRRTKSWHKFISFPAAIRMIRGGDSGGGAGSANSSLDDERTDDSGGGGGCDERFVYRVVGDHSPLWTTLTQAQSITDYESWRD